MDDDEEITSPQRRAADLLAFVVMRFMVGFIQALPLDMADSFCRLAAKLLTFVVVVRRKTLDENMRLIFPHSTPQEQLALREAMWHHLLLMICEIAWAPRRLHLTNWMQHIRVHDNRTMLRQLLSDRPTILVTGHFGNFEIGGYVVGLMGFPTVTIARRLDNPYLHRFLEGFRETHGQFMVDKEGCAPLIDRHLAAGGTLSLLADQHAGQKGCWVDFLGADASCHKALALFSLTSGAPMIVGYTRRLGRPMYFESGNVAIADPENDSEGVCAGVRPLTQWYSDRLAEAIEPALEQYWWVHRRWRFKPLKLRGVAQAA
ncbi:MAG: lysophospholipid acyltransferase family protein [Planctomycetaceae bacterium]